MIDRKHQIFLVEEPGGMSINYMTPPAVAEKLCDLAKLSHGLRMLEPSAGTGIIAEEARRRGCTVECVDVNPDFVDVLRQAGFTTHHADFVHWTAPHLYERVIMNPPFNAENELDLLHIRRAWQWVKEGGILVSVASQGLPRNRRFGQWLLLHKLQWEWHALPDGAYGLVEACAIVIHAE